METKIKFTVVADDGDGDMIAVYKDGKLAYKVSDGLVRAEDLLRCIGCEVDQVETTYDALEKTGWEFPVELSQLEPA